VHLPKPSPENLYSPSPRPPRANSARGGSGFTPRRVQVTRHAHDVGGTFRTHNPARASPVCEVRIIPRLASCVTRMRRGSVPTVAHPLRVHRLANQPVKSPVNRVPSPISRSPCRNSFYAESHEDASCVRRPSDTFAVLGCLFTWDNSKSRPKAVRTRNSRHFSQKCPSGIECCERGRLEALRYLTAVKCSRT
jgi:hypothetical protein